MTRHICKFIYPFHIKKDVSILYLPLNNYDLKKKKDKLIDSLTQIFSYEKTKKSSLEMHYRCFLLQIKHYSKSDSVPQRAHSVIIGVLLCLHLKACGHIAKHICRLYSPPIPKRVTTAT